MRRRVLPVTAVPKPAKRGRKPKRRIKRKKRPQPVALAEHKKLEKEADWLWALIIRSMNQGHCIRCRKPVSDAMHLVSRRYRQTRWDFWTPNGAPGCRGCHFLTGHDQHEHVRMVEGWIGKMKWEELNLRKHSRGKMDMKLVIIALEGECKNRGLTR